MRKLSDEQEFIFDVREDFLFYDEQANVLGSPTYRILPGKSGLGYIESRAEYARFEGQCVRWIFTGKFITHNPIYLMMLFLLGAMIGVVPILVVLYSFIDVGALMGFILFIPLSPYIAGGLAILVNVWRSISNPYGFSITGD